MSKKVLQSIANAYIATLKSTIAPQGELGGSGLTIDIQTDLNRWSLYHDADDTDWFIIELDHNVAPTVTNRDYGMYQISSTLQLSCPDGSRAILHPNYSPKATMPGVSFGQGLSFSLSGSGGAVGDGPGVGFTAGVSFDNTKTVSYPGRSIINHTADNVMSVMWQVQAPTSTPEVTQETWVVSTTACFSVPKASRFGSTREYQMALELAGSCWFLEFGAKGGGSLAAATPGISVQTPPCDVK